MHKFYEKPMKMSFDDGGRLMGQGKVKAVIIRVNFELARVHEWRVIFVGQHSVHAATYTRYSFFNYPLHLNPLKFIPNRKIFSNHNVWSLHYLRSQQEWRERYREREKKPTNLEQTVYWNSLHSSV